MKRVLNLLFVVLLYQGAFAQLKAPKLVTPTANAKVQDVNVLLDWRPSLGGTASGYQAEVDLDTLFSNPLSVTINGSSGRPSELEFGQTYYWRVRGLASTGNSPYSEEKWPFTTFYNEFTTLFPQGPNRAPRQSISWDTIPGVKAYEYKFSKDSNLTNPISGVISHPNNSVLFPQLEFGTDYYWAIRAMHSKDTSGWSDTVTFSTLSQIVLKLPEDSAVERNPKTILECSNTGGVTEYVFQVDVTSNFDTNSLDLTTTTILDSDFGAENISFNTSRLKFNTKYFWRVQGLNNISKANWSEVWTFTTLAKPTLSLPQNNRDSVKPVSFLQWFKVDGSGGYNLQLDTNNTFVNAKTVVLKDDTTTKYLMALNDWTSSSYYWRVQAWHSRDTSDWSDAWDFTIHPVGLAEYDNFENVSVYPNPAKQFVKVDFPNGIDPDANVAIFTITGNMLSQNRLSNITTGANQVTIDVGEFEKGVYFLRLESAGIRTTRKIVVQ